MIWSSQRPTSVVVCIGSVKPCLSEKGITPSNIQSVKRSTKAKTNLEQASTTKSSTPTSCPSVKSVR